MPDRATSSQDDWDRHWQDFGASAEKGPGPKYRRRLVFRMLGIDPADTGMRMLEIGSGTGEFAEEFHRRFPRCEYLGLELSRTGVEIASRRVRQARFEQRDLLQPSKTQSDFRATHAVCSEVLEHVDDPGVLLRNSTSYMATGCRLVVTVPGGPMSAFYRHIGHRRHYSPEELRDLVREAGFQNVQVWGAGFPFFNVFRLLSTLQGEKLIEAASNPPSALMLAAMWTFDLLFRMNLMRWGWQTLAVAEYRP